jgi:hypothetical protein
MAGAQNITRLNIPRALPRFSTGFIIKRVLIILGINTPVPTAWINLPSNKMEKAVATPEMMVPIIKILT